jgi:hypothetical protein
VVREASEATVVEDRAPQHVISEECDCAFRKKNTNTNTHTHTHTCGDECSPLLQSLALDETLDARDVVKKSTDEIEKSKWWWILEIWPTYRQWQEENGQWYGQRRCVTCLCMLLFASMKVLAGRIWPAHEIFLPSLSSTKASGRS